MLGWSRVPMHGAAQTPLSTFRGRMWKSFAIKRTLLKMSRSPI